VEVEAKVEAEAEVEAEFMLTKAEAKKLRQMSNKQGEKLIGSFTFENETIPEVSKVSKREVSKIDLLPTRLNKSWTTKSELTICQREGSTELAGCLKDILESGCLILSGREQSLKRLVIEENQVLNITLLVIKWYKARYGREGIYHLKESLFGHHGENFDWKKGKIQNGIEYGFIRGQKISVREYNMQLVNNTTNPDRLCLMVLPQGVKNNCNWTFHGMHIQPK